MRRKYGPKHPFSVQEVLDALRAQHPGRLPGWEPNGWYKFHVTPDGVMTFQFEER